MWRCYVCLVVGSLATWPTHSLAQCYSQGDTVFCSTCPGWQECICLYEGAICLDRQVCNSTKALRTGTLEVSSYIEACWWSTPCASQHGGDCHPVTNPCITTGPVQPHGTIVKYTLSPGCIITRSREPSHDVHTGVDVPAVVLAAACH